VARARADQLGEHHPGQRLRDRFTTGIGEPDHPARVPDAAPVPAVEQHPVKLLLRDVAAERGLREHDAIAEGQLARQVDDGPRSSRHGERSTPRPVSLGDASRTDMKPRVLTRAIQPGTSEPYQIQARRREKLQVRQNGRRLVTRPALTATHCQQSGGGVEAVARAIVSPGGIDDLPLGIDPPSQRDPVTSPAQSVDLCRRIAGRPRLRSRERVTLGCGPRNKLGKHAATLPYPAAPRSASSTGQWGP